MAVGYVRVRRKISVGENPGLKYLAIIQRGQSIEFNQVATEISDISSLGQGDVMNVLKTLESVMVKYIMNGSSVKLGLLGSFITSIRAKACDNIEDVNSSTIKEIKCRFKPSVEFANKLKTAKTELKNLDVKGYQKKDTQS